MGDEKLYQQVRNELEGKPRKYTDRVLMIKAEILSEGDEKKKVYKYIKLRVEQLKEKEKEKTEKLEKIRIEKEQKTAKKELKIKQEEERLNQEEERLNIKETNTWIFWITFISAIIITRRLGGILGFASIMLGYYVFSSQRKKKKHMLLAICAGVGASLICYLVLASIFFSSIPFIS